MSEVKRIAIGSDHAATGVKDELKRHLEALGWEVNDYTVVQNGAGDYTDVGRPLAEAVARGEFAKGVLLCGTGLGMSYVANRVPGIRAALCLTVEFAKLAREHNDSNILVMPGRAPSVDPQVEILDAWLSTPFSGHERHKRRIHRIDHPND